MNRYKFEAAIDELTSTIAGNEKASDLLQLLLADYYETKVQCEDQLRTIAGLQGAPELANILEEIAPLRAAALENFTRISNEEKQVLKNLAEAQQNIAVARKKIQEYVQVYENLHSNTEALKKNVKGMAGGLIRSLLGPAVELGPVKNLADRLFA